jgi:hypothetical protein
MDLIFSIIIGVVVTVVGGLILNWLWERRKKKSAKSHEKETPKPLPNGDDIQINSAGDVVFAKDNSTAIQVKNSQVGVVGNNTKINGGIHFKNQK